MAPNSKQSKPIFKFIVTSNNIFMQTSKPKRNTMIIIVLLLLLGIALLIASNVPELRSKALDLVVSIIEAILTFFSASLKNK